MDALLLENVEKSFGRVRAVDGLSLAAPAGCSYGFLGPNGAGKTTTIRMVMNIILPDSGRIEVLGRVFRSGVSGSVGYMPEERGLYRKMQVRAVLEYFGRLKGLGGREARQAATRWLERVELADCARRRVEDLSRGMHQKLQFAVTVVNDPELLILDEPFAALDPVNVDVIKAILLQMRSEGKTIILSTHIMEHAEQMCDHILLIDKGRKVLDGKLDEIRNLHRTNSVMLDTDASDEMLAGLPMVERVSRSGACVTAALRDGCDSQQLLAALVGRARIRSFEEKRATLHEIFVRLVSGAGAHE